MQSILNNFYKYSGYIFPILSFSLSIITLTTHLKRVESCLPFLK